MLLQAYMAEQRLEILRHDQPRLFYEPHNNGQLQFHQSNKAIRILIPGNFWGKTTAAAMEVDALAMHDNRWGGWDKMPDHPPTIIWVSQKDQQFDLLRPQLEMEAFTKPWRWRSGDRYYEWLHTGAKMYAVSGQSDWTAIQGIPVDMVVFDEHPPAGIWRELMMRRRGKRKTRFVVAATMTLGETWFVKNYIKKWEEHHISQGLTIREAEMRQNHPQIFVWESGGVDSNPGADEEDKQWYYSQTFLSEKERQVRLFGGYADFTGDQVFDAEALMKMESKILSMPNGRDGSLIPIFHGDPKLSSVWRLHLN